MSSSFFYIGATVFWVVGMIMAPEESFPLWAQFLSVAGLWFATAILSLLGRIESKIK